MTPVGGRLLGVLLAMLGGLAWWLYPAQEAPGPPAVPQERRPDQVAERFTATTMDLTGAPQRRLLAQELRHYSLDGTSEVDQPVLTLYQADTPPWVIRSTSGVVSPRGERIELRGDVRIDRAGDEGLRPLHLRTEWLQVEPEAEIARTDQPVHLTSDGDWMSSEHGAQVWFGEALRVELYGRTRARMAVPGAETPATDHPEEDP